MSPIRTIAAALTASLTVGGCGDDAGDGSADTGGSTTTTTGGPIDDASTTGAADNTGGGMFTMGQSSDGGSTTSGGGTAMLVFPGGDPYDFLFEEIGDTDVAALEILNIGNAAATGVTPTGELAPEFTYTGGRFPGELGNCQETIPAGEMCIVHIEFRPMTLGPLSSTLELAYSGGERGVATLQLLAEARGTTANLVPDGGFEACRVDGSPDAWAPDGRGAVPFVCSEATDSIDPQTGDRMLVSAVPNGAPTRMTLQLDLGSMNEAIASGEVTSTLNVWGQSSADDQHQVTLEFLDAARGSLETFDSGALDAADWTETVDERAVPTTAAFASIGIACVPGAEPCEATVDDVSFTLTR